MSPSSVRFQYYLYSLPSLTPILGALLADPDTPEPLVSIMIDVLFVLAVSETDFIRLVSEIISDIRDNAAAIGPSSTNSNTAMSHVPAELSPTERKQLEMHVARLKVQLHQLHERQRLAVDQEDFAAASAAKADKDGVEAQMKEISARLVPIGQVGGGGGHVVEVSVVGPQRDSAFTVAKALLLAKEIFMRVNQVRIGERKGRERERESVWWYMLCVVYGMVYVWCVYGV